MTKGLLNILLVEDDPDTQFVVKAALDEIKDVKVRSASSGSDALKRAAEFTPELIILDFNLPDMTGTEVLKKLREKKELAEIPVLFLTAYPDDLLKHYADSKTIHVVPKPFNPLLLNTIISRVLNF